MKIIHLVRGSDVMTSTSMANYDYWGDDTAEYAVYNTGIYILIITKTGKRLFIKN